MEILLVICSLIILIAFLDKYTFLLKKWTFLCDYGWHIAETTEKDAVNNYGYCMRCGKKVIKDSNGDWF